MVESDVREFLEDRLNDSPEDLDALDSDDHDGIVDIEWDYNSYPDVEVSRR
jgi:hypothetical protein